MVRHWSTRLPRKRDEPTFHVSKDREMILRSVFLFVQVVWVILCPCHHKKTARAESVDKTCGYNLRQPTNKVNKYFVEYIALLMTQNFPAMFFVRKANNDDRRMCTTTYYKYHFHNNKTLIVVTVTVKMGVDCLM